MLFELLARDERLFKGSEELSSFCGFRLAKGGRKIKAVKSENGLTVEGKEGEITLSYSTLPEFYLGLGLCVERYAEANFCLKRKCKIERLGLMRDCARNAAISFGGFQTLVKTLALLGYTYIELYVEDLMELPEYPYLGQSRPRYSVADFKRFDEYAQIFGIELVPCIQTLAHYTAATRQWDLLEIFDFGDTLCVGEEKTYEFLDAVIGFCAEAFTSRRINIGMDEAFSMGLGKYREKHGYPENKGELLLEHLNRVNGLCKKRGFKPSMWSDTLFRFGLGGAPEYKDVVGKRFSEAFKAKMPNGVTLVFWNYDHSDAEFYDKILAQHFELTQDVAFACGAWTWKGFAPFNTIAENNSLAALESCIKNGVSEFLVTVWGDNGAECSTFSALSTYLKIAETAYGGDTSAAALNARSLALFGNTYEEFLSLEDVNRTHLHTIKDGKDINPCKYLFYNDPLLGVMDAHVYPELKEYYERNARTMGTGTRRTGTFGYLFETLEKLCECLSVKATLGAEITQAYLLKNTAMLEKLTKETLPETIRRVEAFYEAFETQWFKENSGWGFEVIGVRIGGLEERLRRTRETLQAYLSGELERIEELEQPRLPFSVKSKAGDDVVCNDYAAIASGSDI